MTSIAARARYTPSGRVDWRRFLPLSAIPLLIAAIAAFGMNALYAKGWYLLFLVPGIAAAIVAGFAVLTIHLGKCRSPAVGALLGLFAGLVLYLGYFYFGMLSFLGYENAARLDLLPRYIQLRMRVDTTHELPETIPHNNRPADPVSNWLWFGLEFGVVLLVLTGISRQRAARAYCESCGQWKAQHSLILAPGYGQRIAEWLEQGELANLAGVPKGNPTSKRFTTVAIEMCLISRAGAGCAVYLAAKDASSAARATAFNRFDGVWGKMALRRVELTADEIQTITPVFPQLAAGFEQPPIPQRSPPTAISAARLNRIDVQPLSSGVAGKIMNAWSITVSNILSLAILVVFFGAIMGAIGGLFLLKDFNLAHLDRFVPGFAIVLVSIVLAVVSGYIGLQNASALGNQYLLRRARHFIAMRPDKIVDPSRPDLMAFFVEVAPRQNWQRLMLETATDVGFLQVDPRLGELRFEGNKERYKIPGAAIENCLIEQVNPPGNTRTVYHFVTVRGQTATAPWEAPFCVRQAKFFVAPNHRARSGQELYAAITSIIPAAQKIPVMTTAPIPVASSIMPGLDYSSPQYPLPASTSWWKTYGLRLVIVLFFVAFGIWRGIATQNQRRPFKNITQIQIPAGGPSIAMNLTNIRLNQRVSDSSPYFQPGGDWTVFDCAPTQDPQASLTVGVQSPRSPIASTALRFSSVLILSPSRDSGSRLISDLATSLQQPLPPPRQPQPLKPLKFGINWLGDHLAPPENAFAAGGGSWVATQWYVINEGLNSQIYFFYDLTSGRAQFSRATNAEALAGLAAGVRDGPLPPRTAQNDPNFTDDGPKVIDLVALPDSVKYGASFAEGGKFVKLIGQGSPSDAIAFPLDNLSNRIPLAHVEGRIGRIFFVDPEAHCLLVSEHVGIWGKPSPDDRNRFWWIDRDAQKKKEVTGRWSKFALLFGPSPDGRYAAVTDFEGTVLDQRRTLIGYVVDLQSGRSARVAQSDLHISGWIGTGDDLRLIVHDRRDTAREILVDPASGKTMSIQASGKAQRDDTISPDGKLRYLLHENTSVDIIDVATGDARTFTFEKIDRNMLDEEGMEWLSPRYLAFDGERPSFLDVRTMKMGFLPTLDGKNGPLSFEYSPDFKWALITTEQGTSVGRVSLPAAAD